MKYRPLLAAFGIALAAGNAPANDTPASPPALQDAYRAAVQDASIATADEIFHDLFPISPANSRLQWSPDKQKVLVATWKAQSAYEQYLKNSSKTSDNEGYVVWVSAVPQVQEFCKNYLKDHPGATKEQLEQRLKQYLGLAADWKYDVFIEMWVKPEDLFRPCMDPAIDDSQCDMQFGKTAPKVKGIADYPAFYKNLYFGDFRTLPGVPWTGLGYTYDWGSPISKVGASEYILSPGSTYEIKQALPTMGYCGAGT